MPYPQLPLMFSIPGGKGFVYLESLPRDGEVLYTPDGKTLYAVKVCGFSGTHRKHHFTFIAPQINLSGKLYYDDEAVTFNKVVYVEQQACDLSKMTIVELPRTLCEETLCQTEDGKFLLISYTGINQIKVYFDGRQVNAKKTTPPCHSDDIDLRFDGHMLLIGEESTLDGKPLIELEPHDYNIVYGNKTVKITKKT